MKKELGVWFPTIQTGTGTDVFTERLVEGLNKNGIRAEITWLPLRAEYLPWTVKVPTPPQWANIVHISTWLHHRFLPKHLPYVATLHHAIHDAALRPYKSLTKNLYHKYWKAPHERHILKSAAKVTAVSQFVADMTKKTLCDVPIQVIYNGVDTSIFCPTNTLREQHRPFRLLYVGAWRKLKGVDLLNPIMQELGNEYELYYTGGNAAQKDKNNMPANMYDLGRLSQQEVIKEMQMADAFLFPSRSEGFGLVAIEAQACELPVITTNSSALSEVVQHKETGFLCEKNNAQSFIEAIRKLHEIAELQKELSLSARLYVEKNFKMDIIIKQYVETYQSLI